MGWVGGRAEVIAVAAQRGREVSGRAAGTNTDRRAVTIVSEVLVPSRAAAGAFLIDKAVTIIVDTIADFGGTRVCAGIDIVAVGIVEDVAARRLAGGEGG